MKALVLAAGYATRLYPLTKEYPKPLLEVNKKPIIDYAIEKINGIPYIDEIIVVTNSKFFPHFKEWSESVSSSTPISIVDDLTKDLDDRRGAVGDIHFVIAERTLSDDLLVLGGDNIFDGALTEFVADAKERTPDPVIGAYDIKHREQATKYGVLVVGEKNKIVAFHEKPRHPESTLIAMCLYYFSKEKLSLVDEYFKSRADKHDAVGFYVEWLIKKVPVYAHVFSGRWYDIGDHQCYKEAQEKFR
jgi:glucose-1-phosphate thymidylyltransferase